LKKKLGLNKVFIIGPPRSGTTMLGKILNHSGRFTYFIEPNYLWRRYKFSKTEDSLHKNDYNEKHSMFIKRNFEKFYMKNSSSHNNILLEKTPSNCLRIRYILEVFPDAKFIFLFRNFSDILTSIKYQWTNKIFFPQENHDKKNLSILNQTSRKLNIFKRKLSNGEITLANFLPFIYENISNQIHYNLKGEYFYWGPRVTHLYHGRNSMTLNDICIHQLLVCIEYLSKDLNYIDSNNKHILRYEDIIYNTNDTLINILNFIDQDYDWSRSIEKIQKSYNIHHKPIKEPFPLKCFKEYYPAAIDRYEKLGYHI
tara:strand:+ start:20397 stop:21332 length:936 start_codon:yes stop_codon:yes gene_type:complete